MPEGKQFLNPTPPDYSRDFVRPLCEAENEFLQVLVTNFRIRKKGRGIELSVAFGRDTPAIWLRQAKAHLLEHLPADRRVFYQSWFEELLVQREAARIIRVKHGMTKQGKIDFLRGRHSYILRTKQFKTQQNEQIFGTISLS